MKCCENGPRTLSAIKPFYNLIRHFQRSLIFVSKSGLDKGASFTHKHQVRAEMFAKNQHYRLSNESVDALKRIIIQVKVLPIRGLFKVYSDIIQTVRL